MRRGRDAHGVWGVRRVNRRGSSSPSQHGSCRDVRLAGELNSRHLPASTSAALQNVSRSNSPCPHPRGSTVNAAQRPRTQVFVLVLELENA